MNPDTFNKALDACVEYRKQLDEKTNEVARLRELLKDHAEFLCKNGFHRQAADLLRGYPTAPEETLDGVTMDEWYGGFSKIESTEPSWKCHHAFTRYDDETRDFVCTDCCAHFDFTAAPEEPVNDEPVIDWRIKSPKEHIEEGDEYSRNQFWLPVPKRWIGQFVEVREPKVRTRRPLPKQEEIPLDVPKQEEIPLDVIEKSALEVLSHSNVFACLRYLRDEIESLNRRVGGVR